MTELPQWAVEKADEVGDKFLAEIAPALTGGADAKEAAGKAAYIIARALADAAKPKWRTDIESMPIGRYFLAWCPKGGMVLMLREDEKLSKTWSLQWRSHNPEPTHWLPLPDAPEVG